MANEPNNKNNTSRPSTKSSYEPGSLFWSTREKGPSISGRVIFTSLRLLDLPWQYHLLSSGLGLSLIKRMGGTAVPQPSISSPPLGLSPYHTLILSLAIGAAAKQIYWLLLINHEVFPAYLAAPAAVYNTILNTANTLFALWLTTSQQPGDQSSLTSFITTSTPALLLGTTLYITGLFLEWYSEIQRFRFKADPANKGKPYSGGLFGLARNINYGGYTLWRSGYSLVCGGWVWGPVMCTWLAGDFIGRAIPSMDVYCERRYGEQWEEVRRKVPYKLLPWIY